MWEQRAPEAARRGRPAATTHTPCPPNVGTGREPHRAWSHPPPGVSSTRKSGERKTRPGFIFQDIRGFARPGPHGARPAAQCGGRTREAVAAPSTASAPDQTQRMWMFHPPLPYFFLISSCLDFISALLKNKRISFSIKIFHDTKRRSLHFLPERPGTGAGGRWAGQGDDRHRLLRPLPRPVIRLF